MKQFTKYILLIVASFGIVFYVFQKQGPFLNSHNEARKQQVAIIQESNIVIDQNKNNENQEGILGEKLVDCFCETTFQKQYPIEWSGIIIAAFSSGEHLGIKRFDQSRKYRQFYLIPDENYDKYLYKVGNSIRVKGNLTGITCAYANTVFGECVGEVFADSIEILKK